MTDWIAQAIQHREAGQWEASIQCLQQALVANPVDANVLHDLGVSLLIVGRPNAAIAPLTEATRLAPTWLQAHLGLGEACMADGDAQGALAAYEQAVKLDPRNADLLVKLGVAAISWGQVDRAKAAFDAAIAVDPQYIAAYYNRSGLKKYSESDPEIDVLDRLLPTLTGHEKVMTHFILGKAAMDKGQSDRAFEHYHAGNQLKRSTLSYDVERDIARMAEIAEIVTGDLVESLKGGGATSDAPIFVVGMPRSGSTLIEQILASHPMIGGVGERPAFRIILDHLQGPGGQKLEYPGFMRTMRREWSATIGEAYLRLISASAPDKPRVVDKFLGNFLYLGAIHCALPNAKIIHCRRDPVDTCLSCYTLLMAGEQDFIYDLEELGRYWRAYDCLMSHWRGVLPADRFIEVEYEKVVGDVRKETAFLLEFLGVPWDDACLSFYQTQRSVLSASNAQVRAKVHGGSVGRWKPHAKNIKPLLDILGVQSV